MCDHGGRTIESLRFKKKYFILSLVQIGRVIIVSKSRKKIKNDWSWRVTKLWMGKAYPKPKLLQSWKSSTTLATEESLS